MVINGPIGTRSTFPIDKIKSTVTDAFSSIKDLVLLANRQTAVGQRHAHSISCLADASV